MKSSVLICLIFAVIVRSNKVVRKPPTKPCFNDNCDGEPHILAHYEQSDECCINPCPGCAENLKVTKQECAATGVQTVFENTILECDYSESHPITRIEFTDYFPYETTCFGVLPGKTFEEDVYTLVLKDESGRESRENISGDYQYIINFNQGILFFQTPSDISYLKPGNVLYYEEAKLRGCHCAGATLKGFYALVSDNTLTDCCADGMTHENGVYGVVELYSTDPKCCATCRMVETSVIYERPITNFRA